MCRGSCLCGLGLCRGTTSAHGSSASGRMLGVHKSRRGPEIGPLGGRGRRGEGRDDALCGVGGEVQVGVWCLMTGLEDADGTRLQHMYGLGFDF